MPREEYMPYVQEIHYAYAKIMKEKLVIPSGYGRPLGRKEEMLSMDFAAHCRATIKVARGFQLITVDQFVKALNKISRYNRRMPYCFFGYGFV